MRIGVPKESKDHESRVALPPEAVADLVQAGHAVRVAEGAGEGSGFSNADYRNAGAGVVAQEKAFDAALVLKVKEPQPDEIEHFHAEQVLFTYLHLAADQTLTTNLMRTGVTAIAYEAVQTDDGALPLLAPMSRVAGALAVTVGAGLLETHQGGSGVLLPALGDDPGARVTVLGAGVVGAQSARVAYGMGARVTVLDRDPAALKRLARALPGIDIRVSDPALLQDCLLTTDLLVGAVLVPGSAAPRLVTREMVRGMPKGSVIVDVAIDQGGCVEGIRPTSHTDRSYRQDGVLHCAIANLPGVVPLTSTRALAKATLPYITALARLGFTAAVAQDTALSRGVRMHAGKICHPGIAERFALPYNSEFGFSFGA